MSQRAFAAAVLVLLAMELWSMGPLRAARDAPVLRVESGGSISEVLERAPAGTTLEVEPGIYREELLVDRPDITLKGLVRGDSRPVLDGANRMGDGVIATADGFTMSGFRVQNYRGNGVTTQGVEGVRISDLMVHNTGLYGVYTLRSRDIRIAHCIATGIRDAALYVGVSRNVEVAFNEVHHNVAGIEIENTLDASVHDNLAHDNTAGILVFVLPGKEQKAGRRADVRRNRVRNNNHENFGDTATIVGSLPSGIGMLVMGADTTVLEDNWISGNDSLGISINRLPEEQAAKDPALDPYTDYVRIGKNRFRDNGNNPHPKIAESYGAGGDIGWDWTGTGNCASPGRAVTEVGVSLPSCDGARRTRRQKAPRTTLPSPE